MMSIKRAGLFTLALSTMLAITGCSVTTPSVAPTALAGSALHGNVHGGQQPISGAVLQLYAAGSSGYGSAFTYVAGVSLLGNNVVTTDANGGFSITGTYTCPLANTQVYLVATGGNPGLPGNASNPNIALMAALGSCGLLTNNSFISMNELTTVASVWALSPFLSGIANVGSSASNTVGLSNAFNSVNMLVNIATGTPSGPALPAGATIPFAKMNTLADILAACVNSTGGTAGDGSPCGDLFADTAVNGVFASDTINAALNIAKHPNTQVGALISIAPPSSPFQPTLASASDFALVITHSGGGISAPKGVAADASGNVWLANSANNTVTELDALGVTPAAATGFLSGSNGFTAGTLNVPVAIAIDQRGNAWIANSGNSTVSMLNANGSAGAIYSGGGLSFPSSIAIDAPGNVWVSNTSNSSITEISATGVLTNLSPTGVNMPIGLAIDPK
jgi:hypothetical protein